MQRARLVLRGTPLEAHPVFGPLTDPSIVDRAEGLHWNVSDDGRTTALVRIEGDTSTLAAAFEPVDALETVEWCSLEDGSCLAFVRDDGTTVSRAVLRSVTREGLVVVPPVVYANSSATFTVVGGSNVLQTAIDDLPDGLSVDVRAIGDPERAVDPTSTLSKRQLEAAQIALEVGYFDVPREGNLEDVAAELDCATSTAAEHLQRAQSKLVRASLSTAE